MKRPHICAQVRACVCVLCGCVCDLQLVSLIFTTIRYQWRIQDFPLGGGAPTPKVGVLIYYFCRKLHENEGIWNPPWICQWLCLASYHVFSDNLRVTDHAINTLFDSSHAFTLCIQNHSFLITTTCKVITFPIFSVMLLIKTEIITTHLKNNNIGCIQIKLTTGRVNLP